MGLSTPYFLLVMGTAALHATWNFKLRGSKGSIGVFVYGMILASTMTTPFAIWLLDMSVFVDRMLYIVLSGIFHAGYAIMLSLAYSRGNLSVVYPVARGTGIGLTAIVANFWFSQPLSVIGWLGISSIIVGIVLIGFECAFMGSVLRVDIPPDKYVVMDENEVQMGVIDGKNSQETDAPATLPPPAAVVSSSVSNNEQCSLKHKRDVLGAVPISLCTGVLIASYSLNDSQAVQGLNPVVFLASWTLLASVCLFPYAWFFHRDELRKPSVVEHRVAIVFVGPVAMFGYLCILFAFQHGEVGYIVALREVAVVFGCLLARFFLRESITFRKWIGILCVVGGLVLVKVA